MKKAVDFKECQTEAVKAFDEKRVLLVSQGGQGLPNVMAIGWGSLGILWKRPVFTMLLRSSRHSHGLIAESGEFTVNIMPRGMEEVVRYCGSLSGRDVNKFAARGLTTVPASRVKVPIIKEGIIHFECRIIYKDDVNPSKLAKPILSELYGEQDLHRIHCGEIVACQRA